MPPSIGLRRDAGARRRTEQDTKAPEKETFCKISVSPVYLKAGMGTANFADNSSAVNVHAWMPTVGLELGMLLLNLVVWLEAAARLAGAVHAV